MGTTRVSHQVRDLGVCYPYIDIIYNARDCPWYGIIKQSAQPNQFHSDMVPLGRDISLVV